MWTATTDELSIRKSTLEGTVVGEKDREGDSIIIVLESGQKFELHHLKFSISTPNITGFKRHQK